MGKYSGSNRDRYEADLYGHFVSSFYKRLAAVACEGNSTGLLRDFSILRPFSCSASSSGASFACVPGS